MTIHTYLPQDRRRALARGEELPSRTAGAALFADISGFTSLTEALRDALGPRRGAEELSRHLDAVYTALITEVERVGGSVISFAGDAITCWLDDADGSAAPRALACAMAMQRAMGRSRRSHALASARSLSASRSWWLAARPAASPSATRRSSRSPPWPAQLWPAPL